MNVSADTVLQAVIYNALMTSAPSDFEMGMLKGQLFAARLIGPADPALLEQAMAAINALRPTLAPPAAAPELLAALVDLEKVADESLDMRATFRRAVSMAHTAIAQHSPAVAA